MIDKLFLIFSFTAIIVLIALAIYMIGQPSCADRGGHSVFSHFQMIVTQKGIMNVPIYKCVGGN